MQIYALKICNIAVYYLTCWWNIILCRLPKLFQNPCTIFGRNPLSTRHSSTRWTATVKARGHCCGFEWGTGVWTSLGQYCGYRKEYDSFLIWFLRSKVVNFNDTNHTTSHNLENLASPKFTWHSNRSISLLWKTKRNIHWYDICLPLFWKTKRGTPEYYLCLPFCLLLLT